MVGDIAPEAQDIRPAAASARHLPVDADIHRGAWGARLAAAFVRRGPGHLPVDADIHRGAWGTRLAGAFVRRGPGRLPADADIHRAARDMLPAAVVERPVAEAAVVGRRVDTAVPAWADVQARFRSAAERRGMAASVALEPSEQQGVFAELPA
ncbi:hypothetical protein [Microvirga alba]|uniref:hypothetical protein n=1 Tax=Microvirga alba TaxID=2791025 RepID=UPI00227716C6|nr:hypothetical protein [Microvirga alba]